ncbi:hypothetical protein OG897_08505 [Streptomyces sp. NBC_00237]|uniref:hypothetical protein n=1 Tax=Streptomyces sp. NBC_00237 TaxID=2975687 RepID=UPI00225737C7|nr:hypothetical protein [Streptomyces sp. NBC_00237]MCX5201492.1 hypothetical protein [Streptomyces sp. NBC_00237]
MTEQQIVPQPPIPPTPPAPEPVPDAVALQAEVEKWKALSRTNEKRWNESSAELDTLKKAGMSDQEKALETARAETRTATLSEVATSLVEAEIRAQSASAGVTAPTEYLDLTRFLAKDGKADADKVKTFIASLPKPDVHPPFPQIQGGTGHSQPGGTPFTSMDPNELADLIAGGRFI